jgi:hypoxanthine phosphoribosyltransferase
MSKVLLTEREIYDLVEAQADEIAPKISDDTVCVAMLTGAIWYAADLMRSLSRRGVNPLFDAIWLGSYDDARHSRGSVTVRAGLQRGCGGKQVLLLDDVFDSGLSLYEASRMMREAGAARVLTAVFATKPWPHPRTINPDFSAWDAPGEFLIGYGMDDAGRMRGLPEIWAV